MSQLTIRRIHVTVGAVAGRIGTGKSTEEVLAEGTCLERGDRVRVQPRVSR